MPRSQMSILHVRTTATASDEIIILSHSGWNLRLLGSLAIAIFFSCSTASFTAAQSRVPWIILSSTTGDLPSPNGGKEQTSCVVADIEPDGDTDFFITDRSVAPSVILYRRQAGGWQKCIVEASRLLIEAGGDAADIDGDGDLDVAFGQDNSGGDLWWWENPGAALDPATPWVRRLIKSGGVQQHDQRFGDFDGDGRLEFATWVNGSRTVEIYEIPLNPKASSWTRVAVIPASGEGMDVADVDLDGKMDILIGGHWIRHEGGTTYQKNVIDGNYTNTRIKAGQFIPGGRPEVLLNSGDSAGPLNFYRYNGSAWQKTVVISQVDHGHTLEVGDFDQDGHLDFFAAEMGSPGAGANCKAWIGYGDGAGNFSLEIIRTGICNHMSRVADLDGDGRLDILMKPYSQGAPRVDVLLNRHATSKLSLNSWVRRVIDTQKPWQAVFITSGDINRDGLQDIVTGGWWYRNPGSPSGAWTRNTIGTPLNNFAVVSDFDNDGDLDILGTQGQGSVSDARFVWARNNGSGSFTILNNVSTAQGDFVQGAAVGRFSSGGPLEVALSWHSGGQ
ncbi:MAG TPA: VCBS repeat-containing protein, partial [Verrucomicrobiae bacterium]|nr:VCBS repeat-containing protein [Verrucomicrobiae bacterium]